MAENFGNNLTSQMSFAVKGINPSPVWTRINSYVQLSMVTSIIKLWVKYEFCGVCTAKFTTCWLSCPYSSNCCYSFYCSCCGCSCSCGSCGWLFTKRHIALLPSYPLGGGVAPDPHFTFFGRVPAVVVVSDVRVCVPLGDRLIPILTGSTRLRLVHSSGVGDTRTLADCWFPGKGGAQE